MNVEAYKIKNIAESTEVQQFLLANGCVWKGTRTTGILKIFSHLRKDGSYKPVRVIYKEGREISHSGIDYYYQMYPGKVELKTIDHIRGGKTKMQINEHVAKLYERTEDAIVVSKHFGQYIGNPIIALLLLDKRDDVLSAAKNLEAEEQKKNKDESGEE